MAVCKGPKREFLGVSFSEATDISSCHGFGMGGYNISIPDDDASLLFQNPALMANVSDKSINLSFLTYMQGCKAGNASWVMSHGERGSWGVGAQFLGYGSMREFSAEEVESGDFSALDMAISGGYTYALTEHLSGGATGKFIYSKYGSYNSVALAVDLGINYWNDFFEQKIVWGNLCLSSQFSLVEDDYFINAPSDGSL